MEKKEKLIVLSGAGISAESGLNTFRDSGGLWEGYNIADVATPEAWARNPAMVQDFYNQRRKSVLSAKPNSAHYALVNLEDKYDVTVITQNVDDLHERAGSNKVVHLHGLITKAQSGVKPDLLYDISGWELKIGELCEFGSQLRPNVVWFGEAVPLIEWATDFCKDADILIVIGTSLSVYPAAGLVHEAPVGAKKYLVNIENPGLSVNNWELIIQKSTIGVPELVERLMK